VNKDLVHLKRPRDAARNRQYVVTIWWLEKHSKDVAVNASGPEEAVAKVEEMIDSGRIALAGSGAAGELYDWNVYDGARASN
jgi:hypothetical protein